MSDRSRDAMVLVSVCLMLAFVSVFYYLEAYGIVLAAVFGCAAADLYNRTSIGQRVRNWLRPNRQTG